MVLVTACSNKPFNLLNTSDSKSISSFSYIKLCHKIVSSIMTQFIYTESEEEEEEKYCIISKYVL